MFPIVVRNMEAFDGEQWIALFHRFGPRVHSKTDNDVANHYDYSHFYCIHRTVFSSMVRGTLIKAMLSQTLKNRIHLPYLM